jgi:hypothetical protein
MLAKMAEEAQAQLPSAEEALRRIVDAGLNHEELSFLDALTSEAYVDLLHIGRAVEGLEEQRDIEIEGRGQNGDDWLFTLRLHANEKLIELNVVMRVIRGAWLVTAVKLPGVRD